MPTPVDTFQLVVFVEPAEGRTSLGLFQKMFKADPLGFNSLPGSVSQSNGISGGFNVVVQSQSTRIDLVLSAPSASPEEDASIGDVEAASAFAIRSMTRILPNVSAQRVAIVIQRSQAHADAAAAVAAIRAAVPNLESPPGAVDLWYQTSVIRESKAVSGLNLTFIRRWNTGTKKLLQLTMGPEPSLSFGGPNKIVSIDHVDVFSTDSQKLFPKKANAVMEELAVAAGKLLSDGYASFTQI